MGRGHERHHHCSGIQCRDTRDERKLDDARLRDGNLRDWLSAWGGASIDYGRKDGPAKGDYGRGVCDDHWGNHSGYGVLWTPTFGM